MTRGCITSLNIWIGIKHVNMHWLSNSIIGGTRRQACLGSKVTSKAQKLDRSIKFFSLAPKVKGEHVCALWLAGVHVLIHVHFVCTFTRVPS